MVTEFGLDLSGLVLDMTNFATFIDSGNDRAPIAQRGKAKQNRTDLRLVGLALIVTRDGGAPIMSHPDAGDRPDVTQFPTVVEDLMARYRQLVDRVDSLTLVYDAGQNSARNHTVVEDSGSGWSARCRPRITPICWSCRRPSTALSMLTGSLV
jgi:transposase